MEKRAADVHQPRISHFFLPKRPTVINLIEEEEDRIDLTEPLEMPKHSFFKLNEDRVRSYEERPSEKTCRIKDAPLFPSFLGTSSVRRQYHISDKRIVKKDRRWDLSFSPARYWDDEVGSEWIDPPKSNAIEAVYKKIFDGLTKKPADEFDDQDDWLPSGFRDLRVHRDVNLRHVHLVCGPTGIGKSSLAKQVSQALNLDYYEINTCNVRTGKVFEDLLVSSSHQLIGSRSERTVVLIDEVDLVFEGEVGFCSGLSAYLSQAPPNHIILMTSNAPISALNYTWPNNLLVHTIEPGKLVAYDTSDIHYYYPVQENRYSQVIMETFLCYMKRSFSLFKGPPPVSLPDWTLFYLPTWHQIEQKHAGLEEERLLQRRKRATRLPKSHPYLRSDVPLDIVAKVLAYTLS